MPVHVHIHQQEVNDFLSGPGGPVVRAVTALGQQVLNEAMRRCPVDEGRLRASLDLAVEAHATTVTARVGSDLDYAIYVHEGTGLYGPKRALIYPVSAKVMTWIPRTAGQGAKSGKRKTAKDTTRVFARYTRGMKGRPFLVEALEAVSPWPVTIHKQT